MTHIIENTSKFGSLAGDESDEKSRIILMTKKDKQNQRCGSWERCDPLRGAFRLSHAPEGAHANLRPMINTQKGASENV